MSTTTAEHTRERLGHDAPKTPTDLPKRGWWATTRRAVSGFRRDNVTDWAAALTYYGVLSIFPALIVLVSVLGLIGRSATQPLITNLSTVAPGPAKSIFTSAITGIQKSQGSAGAVFVIGLAVAIWSASGYIGAFIRASNAIYKVDEGRPFWKLRPLQLAVTAVMMLLLVVSAVAVVVSGGLAKHVGSLLGVGGTAVTVWNIAKWPVLVVIVSIMFSILYWAAPNVKQPRFRWFTPGGILAVLVWIAASAAFALYVASFANYNKTYGALGGIVIFLVWLWISNIAVLLGAEFNAELERTRELHAGLPAERDIQLPPRDDSND